MQWESKKEICLLVNAKEDDLSDNVKIEDCLEHPGSQQLLELGAAFIT